MDWLNNANVIASLVLAIFGIGGYIYAISTFLKKKASPLQQGTNGSAQTPKYDSQQSTISYKPFSWLEWTEFFAQGLVDMASFILRLTFKDDYEDDADHLTKLGYCAGICLVGGVFAELALTFAIGLLLTGLGINNGWGAAGVIGTILLFTTFSFIYIYHVGLIVEIKQLERHQKSKDQQSLYQSTGQQRVNGKSL